MTENEDYEEDIILLSHMEDSDTVCATGIYLCIPVQITQYLLWEEQFWTVDEAGITLKDMPKCE